MTVKIEFTFCILPLLPTRSETYSLAVLLHGIGQTIETFMDEQTAQNIADNNSTYLVCLQALPEQDRILFLLGYYNAAFQTSIRQVHGCRVSVEIEDIIADPNTTIILHVISYICSAGN